jgi:Icc-related predicted phosphoesterase
VKVRIASDIHLDHYISCQIFPDLGKGDVLVLAGDILSVKYFKTDGFLRDVYDRFLNDCSKNFNQVLYTLGNHEHFGFNYEGTFKTLKEHLPDNIHLLENDTIKIGDWAFVGFTLWTNFRNGNPIEMMDAEQYMNDYKVIRIGSNYRKLRAQDTLNFHLKSRDYLLNQLETLKENVFVISHHAPSYRSIADEYKTSSCNSAYCSDLDELIMKHPQIKYFIHGHTHTPFDYKIGECRVICNPVGYPGQNTGFNPHFYLNL